jgi:transcriptional regulator with XRE-family HTH domain
MRNAFEWLFLHTAVMVRTPQKNFLRAWREHRRMTQAKLAEAVGTTGAVISLLESGDRGLSDKWLRLLAPVLGTRPGHLLEVDPSDVSTDILEIWSDIPEESRQQARAVLATFRARSEGDEPAPTVVENLASRRKVRSADPQAPAQRRRPGAKGD